MNEQRRQILEMLAEGKITADEAERLIGALERERPEQPEPLEPGPAQPGKSRPKYLRVLVTDNPGGDEPGRVNVRIPLQLLWAGVKLTSLIPPKALTRLNTELDKAGVPIDLTQLKPQDLEELIDQIDDVTIDIDDPSGKVKVFCE
jgi:hypothetical protein